MLNTLKGIYLKEEFNPGLIGIFTNPFYFSRKAYWDFFTSHKLNVKGKVLDIGCGSKPYKQFFPITEYIGLEISSKKDKIERRRFIKSKYEMLIDQNDMYYYDGVHIPFPDETFDFILATSVFEHMKTPNTNLTEIWRVLKPDGRVLIMVPFMWGEHEIPVDYQRYTSYGLKNFVETGGFEVIEQRKLNVGAVVLFQLAAAYIEQCIHSDNYVRNVLLSLIFIAPITMLGLVLTNVIPKDDRFYLDNVILIQKVRKNVEI